MPSLGFSIQDTSSRRRRVRDLRAETGQGDAAFVVRMVTLGLVFLAVGLFHDSARAALGRVFGF